MEYNLYYRAPVSCEIFYVDLSSPGEYTIDKVRPCLIIWRDLKTYTVIPITKYKGKIRYSEVFAKKGTGGLIFDSRLKISQITTVSEEQILNKMGTVSNSFFDDVIEKIMLCSKER